MYLHFSTPFGILDTIFVRCDKYLSNKVQRYLCRVNNKNTNNVFELTYAICVVGPLRHLLVRALDVHSFLFFFIQQKFDIRSCFGCWIHHTHSCMSIGAHMCLVCGLQECSGMHPMQPQYKPKRVHRNNHVRIFEHFGQQNDTHVSGFLLRFLAHTSCVFECDVTHFWKDKLIRSTTDCREKQRAAANKGQDVVSVEDVSNWILWSTCVWWKCTPSRMCQCAYVCVCVYEHICPNVSF